MDPDTICLCGHKNNSHSDSGCQYTECSCEKWREYKPENLHDEAKINANTTTRKLAKRFEKMTSHKTRLKKDSDVFKMQKTPSSKLSKSEKFDYEENLRDELYKLQDKEEWEKIDEQLQMRLNLDNENVNIWIEKGQNFLNWEKEDDAIFCFKNALMFERYQDNTFDKKNYQLLISLSKIYYEKKEYTEAIKYCDESLKIEPNYIQAFKQLGKIYRDVPNYELSKQYFCKVLKKEDENVEVLNDLGYVYQVNEEWDEAINCFSQSRQINERENVENKIYAEVCEAHCYMGKNDLEHAELLINKEKVVKNNNQHSYKVRGSICKELKKFQEAVENFERECNSGYSVRDSVWFDLAYCEQKIGNLEVSIEYYKKDIGIYGLGAVTSQNIGYAYAMLGQYQNALKWYNSGLEKFPGTIPLLINKAGVYRKQLQYDDAIECYDEVINKNPSLLCCVADKAECLSSSGKHKEAIKLYEAIREALTQSETMPQDSEDMMLTEEDMYWQMIAVPPEREECDLEEENLLNYISWEWIKLGEYEKGLTIVEEALEINSKKAEIIDTKAVALKKLGKFEEAKEWYEKVFEITKKDEDEMEIAICHRKAGNSLDEENKEKYNIESIKMIDKILEKNNSNSYALYHKALSYWNLKQYEEAKKCIKSAIKINPNKMEYWHELGEIAFFAENNLVLANFYYDKCIEINPISENYKQKAEVLLALKQQEEAIKNYNIAIDTYDETKLLFPFGHKENIISQIWNNKGNAWSELEKYDDAIDCYNKSLEYSENNHMTITNKGNQLRKLKKYDDAIDCWNSALEINPKYYRPQYLKILTYTELKKYNNAEELAIKVLTQHPDEIEATTELLVELYEKTEETSKQKEYEKKLQELRDLKNNKTDGV